jgi:hypothetical protein
MGARTTQRGTGQELAGTAKAAAQRAKQEVSERFGAEKSSFARQVTGVAEALRATAEQLEEHEQSALAGLAERAADVTERFGGAIEGKSLADIVAELERAARERPLVAGALAVGVGFLAARFVRSSAEEAETDEEEAFEPEPPSGRSGRAQELES